MLWMESGSSASSNGRGLVSLGQGRDECANLMKVWLQLGEQSWRENNRRYQSKRWGG